MIARQFPGLPKIVLLLVASLLLGACSSSSKGNNDPTVNAGADLSVGEGANVTLSATGTGVGTLTYAWSQTAGTVVVLSSTTVASPTFTAPLVAADEVLTFQVQVTDTESKVATDTVNVTIVNGGPTADAGADQAVVEGAAVALDGSGSSQMTGGVIVSYSWAQTAGTPVENLLGADTTAPTFDVAQVGADEVVTFELTVTDDDGDTDTDTVDIAVSNDTAPVANAGPDQTVPEGTSPVTLDGSASSDAVGSIVSYAWTQTGGTVVVLSGADTTMPTFMAPLVTAAGETLTFELTVTDDSGQSGADTVDVVIQNTNQLPTANAGPDQMVSEGANVNLDGSASADSDGTIATYAWTQTAGPTVTITGANTATPSFTAPLVASPTTLTFQLTVTDNDGGQGSDAVDILITTFNAPPIANAGADQSVDDESVVILDGSASTDPDGAIAGYAWVQTAGTNVTLNNANTAMPSFTAPNVIGASEVFTFQLTVTDNDAVNPKQGVDSVDVVVNPVNTDPVANAGADQSVDEQSAVNLNGSGSSDPDGSVASYAWTQTAGTNVVLTGADTATPNFTAPSVSAAGETLTFQLQVTDNEGATDTDTVDVQVNNDPTLGNAPVANAGADQTVNEATLVTLDGTGSTDSDGTITAYQWTQTAGPVVAITNADQATATFTSPAAPASLTFQLQVTDDDAATDTDSVVITVNAPPVANAGPDQSVDEQSVVNLDGSASNDPGGAIATYAWTQTGGTNVTLAGANTATPNFTAPSVGLAGETLTFQLVVTDGAGANDSDTVDIQVNNDPTLSDPPVANAGPDQTVDGGVLVTLDGTGSSDTDGTITAYQWTQTAGTAVTITNANQAIATFTAPAAPDSLTFQLLVTDNDAATDTDTVVITVNAPPVANAGPDQSVDEQSAVNLDGTGSNDPGGSIASYAWTQTGGTAVVLTGAATATPSFTAPSVDAAGETLTFQLQVTDGAGANDTDTVDVQVNNDPTLGNAPVANAGADQTVDESDLVTLDGSASTDSDGTISAYLWTQTAGPAVVITNATQAVATFTAPAAPASLTFQLQVTDNDAATDTDTVVITVNAPPVANAGPDQSVNEETLVNLDGSASNDPGGAIATYAWTQTAGTAVVLTGGNTATPSFTAPTVTSAGETLTFQLEVTDGAGASDTDTVDIQIDNDPTLNIPPVANAGPDQNVGEAVLVTLDGSASTDDGSITDYAWTQTAGTAVVITNDDQAVATFTSPAGPETLTFQLQVTDDEGGIVSDAVDIVISGTITVSGRITFSEIPHGVAGTGLDYTGIVAMPARLVTVQLIDATDDVTVLESTTTDANGDYSMTPDPNTDVFLRVPAEMVNAGPSPSWNFRIVDNTNSDAQYVLDSSDFNTGTASQVVNILAETAFDGTDYTVRNGAPFAILDAIYDSFQTVLVADPSVDFVPLNTHWSINNVAVGGDISIGEIGTSFYRGGNPIDGIYLLGSEDNDTEEYDQHVIVHEWGHYFEDTIARSDSIGGSHAGGDILDIRVAFGEGWGNAWSGIATGDTTYLDSFGTNQGVSGGFDVEDGTILNGVNPAPGWYSERSVQEILYDFVDSNSDGADTTSFGFGPLYDVFIDQQSTTTAFTSIFSFVDALKSDRPADAAAIDALLLSQSIDTVTDAFGDGQSTNDAGSADTFPIYATATVNGGAVNVCSEDQFGGRNKLNTIRFIRLNIPVAGTHTFTATATVIPVGETTDPDMWLRQPPSNSIFEVFESVTADSESGVSQNFLSTGDYIIEVFDFNNRASSKLLSPVFGGPTIGRACFDVTVTRP